MPPHKMSPNRIHQGAENISGNNFFPRYLAAKKSIDDRALNHHVWEALHQALVRTVDREPIHILEIGAGIGTMLARVLEWGLFTGRATYVATDIDPGQLREARQYLSQWAQRHERTLSWSGEYRGRMRTANADLSLVLIPAGAEEIAVRPDTLGPFHLLIAHAVLDLVDFPPLLPRLLLRLKTNGLAYLTCNFDGQTVFMPECDGEQEIIRRYHAAMEERLTGASRTGRRLLRFMQRPGLELLAAGSSDYVIHPRSAGYFPDEIFYLHAIIDTVEQELAQKDNPPPGLAAWASLRHQQVEDGTLFFLARHLDLLVRRQGSLS